MPRVSPSEKRLLLERSWLFQVLRSCDRDRLIASLPQRRYAHGQTIFSQGDPGSSLMVILDGKVRIGITSRQGREVMLGIVEPGEVFGELALLDGRERSADATAVGECVLLSLDRRDLLAALSRSPEAALSVLEFLCGPVRTANDRLEGVVFMPAETRLARLLLALADRHGTRNGDAIRIHVALSQTDLARLIGAQRQTVNQQLSRWLADGTLVRDGRALLLRDRDRFAELAEVERAQSRSAA